MKKNKNMIEKLKLSIGSFTLPEKKRKRKSKMKY